MPCVRVNTCMYRLEQFILFPSLMFGKLKNLSLTRGCLSFFLIMVDYIYSQVKYLTLMDQSGVYIVELI